MWKVVAAGSTMAGLIKLSNGLWCLQWENSDKQQSYDSDGNKSDVDQLCINIIFATWCISSHACDIQEQCNSEAAHWKWTFSSDVFVWKL